MGSYSPECFDDFCSQCTYENCACPCHLEALSDYDDDEEWDEADEYDFESMEEECGETRDGGCVYAGTEYCDWLCPFGGLN